MDLLDLTRSVAERARPGEDVEAFAVHEREFQVKAYLGEVETISSAEPRGMGIRVVVDRRVGFAYSTNLSEDGIGRCLAQARANAAHTTPDDAVGLAPAWPGEVVDVEGLYDERQPSVPVQDKVDFTIELEKATRAHDPRVRTVEEAMYADGESDIAIATSTGIAARYRRTEAWCYSYAIAEDAGDTEVGFDFGLGRGLRDLDFEDVARRSADKALRVLGARKIPTEAMPVIFDPYTSAQFLGVLAAALTGEAVQKGRSLFAGKLGEQVAAHALTLIDDGSIPAAPGSAPWDGEGIPTERTEVIAGGVLSSYLYDLTSARRENRSSTGNAARSGFKSPPSPAPTNLAFDTTGESRDEVLAKAGRAFLVQDFHGVHSGTNPVSGDFSVGATGRIVEDGTPGRPVKEVTIALPMLEILKRVVAVADDRRWLPFGGSLGGATTLVSEMTVAGL